MRKMDKADYCITAIVFLLVCCAGLGAIVTSKADDSSEIVKNKVSFLSDVCPSVAPDGVSGIKHIDYMPQPVVLVAKSPVGIVVQDDDGCTYSFMAKSSTYVSVIVDSDHIKPGYVLQNVKRENSTREDTFGYN